jgi:DNA-binding MarR family transcriptional regulator
MNAILREVPQMDTLTRFAIDEQTSQLLRRAYQRATSLFAEQFGVDGLTPMQFAALCKLHDCGEVSQNLLGRMIAMDPATSQGVMRRLMDQGLVTRRDDPQDRRRTLLSLTSEGRRVVAASFSLGHQVNEALLAPLSAQERATFLELLHKLI